MSNLYQLQVAYNSPRVGDIVIINGPWDKYARIIKLRDNGFHLMRGIGKQKPMARIAGKDLEG